VFVALFLTEPQAGSTGRGQSCWPADCGLTSSDKGTIEPKYADGDSPNGASRATPRWQQSPPAESRNDPDHVQESFVLSTAAKTGLLHPDSMLPIVTDHDISREGTLTRELGAGATAVSHHGFLART